MLKIAIVYKPAAHNIVRMKKAHMSIVFMARVEYQKNAIGLYWFRHIIARLYQTVQTEVLLDQRTYVQLQRLSAGMSWE